MKNCILVFLLIVPLSHSLDCTSGSNNDFLKQLSPFINALKEKITMVSKFIEDRIISTRALILENILDANKLSSMEIIRVRNLINAAKNQAIHDGSISIQTCLTKETIEFSKILIPIFGQCSNFNSLISIRTNIESLKQTTNQISSLCQPKITFIDLKICVEAQIRNVETELLKAEKKFEEDVKDLIHNSLNCLMKKFGEVSEKVGAVLGAISYCKYYTL